MRLVMIAIVALCLGCGGDTGDGENTSNGNGNNSSGACPSWSGTLDGQSISGNGVTIPPSPLNAITLLQYNGEDQASDPYFTGTVSGESDGKSALLASGLLGGVGISNDAQNLLWDKSTSTISGTVVNNDTMEVLEFSVTYENGGPNPPPERCTQ